MKVAIVGGGFYGCYIANTLRKRYKSEVSVDIYDCSNKLMTRAATNNQCRLHLGFHYPRSSETIRQTVEGFQLFLDDFGDCVDFPKHNYYAVHRDGHVNMTEYLAAMDAHNLNYDVVDHNSLDYFKEPQEIEGVVRVGEGVIRLNNLCGKMMANLHAKIFCNTLVTSIDAEKGQLVANGKVKSGYDFIINATYTDTNLGLPEALKFDLKYELTAMVLMNAPFGDDVALTIMDGPFVSLYPAGHGMATLSSVPLTPFFNCSTTSELEAKLAEVNLNHHKNHKKVIDNIMQHGNEMLNLNLSEQHIEGLWIAPKTKILNDSCDQRLTEIKTHGKLISVLCGKLDAVHHITDQILDKMGLPDKTNINMTLSS